MGRRPPSFTARPTALLGVPGCFVWRSYRADQPSGQPCARTTISAIASQVCGSQWTRALALPPSRSLVASDGSLTSTLPLPQPSLVDSLSHSHTLVVSPSVSLVIFSLSHSWSLSHCLGVGSLIHSLSFSLSLSHLLVISLTLTRCLSHLRSLSYSLALPFIRIDAFSIIVSLTRLSLTALALSLLLAVSFSHTR